jgi:hypothetical protein
MASLEAGVTHVELDAAEHMELVRHLRVLRTPTVLLLDPAGHETGRSSGAMSLAQAREALAGLDATRDRPDRPHAPTTDQPSDETSRS